jgi:hypothetical protein
MRNSVAVATKPTKKFVRVERGTEEPKATLKKWTNPLPVIKLVSTDPTITKMDPAYQRPANLKKITKIANNFDIDAFVPPVINARRSKNGKVENFNMDGQHRQLAARMAGYDEMPALFYDIGGQSDEAAMFVRTNRDRTAVSRNSQFKALLTANDPIAEGVQKIFVKYGIQPRNQGRGAETSFQFTAMEKVTSMYMVDPIVFDLTFKTLIDAFEGNTYSLRRRIFVGTFQFIKLYQYSTAFSFPRLVKAMKDMGAENLWILTNNNHAENYQKVVTTLLKIYNLTDGPRLRKFTTPIG